MMRCKLPVYVNLITSLLTDDFCKKERKKEIIDKVC